MPDPFDKLLNDPEWQAYERRVGPEVAKRTLAQIESKYRAKNSTLEVPGNAPPAAAASSGTYSRRKPIMPELARKAKLSDQAQEIMNLGTEMQNLYDKKIKPKLDSGQISPMGQGLEYTYRGLSRNMGFNPDPDVQEFITKSGQFATLVNSYYAQSSGGRGGVQAYEVITMPHIPHPPSGATELLSGNWDLQKQGEQIPTILKNVQLGEGKRSVETYGGPADPSAAAPGLDDAAKKHGVDW